MYTLVDMVRYSESGFIGAFVFALICFGAYSSINGDVASRPLFRACTSCERAIDSLVRAEATKTAVSSDKYRKWGTLQCALSNSDQTSWWAGYKRDPPAPPSQCRG